MKTSYSCSLIVVILLLFTNGIQAQTTQPKLNQMELMKDFLGTWKGETAKDTVMIMNFTPFGRAIENNYKITVKDKILYSGKEIYGYNQKYDKIILASIRDNSSQISLMACWYSSKDTGNLVGYQYLSDPEKATFKIQWILIPPDSSKRIVIQNKNVISVSTFFREKQ
jgi:hypothetical protein